jgi:glycosyltransferase involved in cell wall biosynthesis
MKVLALSWHPGNTTEITTGGYRRFYEIARRSSQELVIIDRYPSLYRDISNPRVQITEYGKQYDFKFLSCLHPIIYDFYQRVISLFQIFIILLFLTPKPRVIYVPYSELSHLSFAAVLAKLLFRSRVVFCNLNVNTIFLERPLNVFLHRFADEIITISCSLQKDLKKTGIIATQINGVGFDMSEFKACQFRTKKYDAIYIGRHIPQKGFFDLLEIWNLLVNKYKKKYSLVTIGNTPKYLKAQIEEKIKNYRLENNLKILGNVTESEKVKYLAASRVFVFPSRQEGWGIAPMEALAEGLSVVAYDLEVYRESIGDTPAFRIVRLGDIDRFAQKTIEMITKHSKYSQSAKLWQPKFSWDYVAKREWELLKTD